MDVNSHLLDKYLEDCEEADAWSDMQERLEAYKADAEEAEKYAEELESRVRVLEDTVKALNNTVSYLVLLARLR